MKSDNRDKHFIVLTPLLHGSLWAEVKGPRLHLFKMTHTAKKTNLTVLLTLIFEAGPQKIDDFGFHRPLRHFVFNKLHNVY